MKPSTFACGDSLHLYSVLPLCYLPSFPGDLSQLTQALLYRSELQGRNLTEYVKKGKGEWAHGFSMVAAQVGFPPQLCHSELHDLELIAPELWGESCPL